MITVVLTRFTVSVSERHHPNGGVRRATLAKRTLRRELADALGVHYKSIGYLERGEPVTMRVRPFRSWIVKWDAVDGSDEGRSPSHPPFVDRNCW